MEILEFFIKELCPILCLITFLISYLIFYKFYIGSNSFRKKEKYSKLCEKTSRMFEDCHLDLLSSNREEMKTSVYTWCPLCEANKQLVVLFHYYLSLTSNFESCDHPLIVGKRAPLSF